MKIDSFPRLNPDDFPDLPEPVRQVLEALNPILEQIIDALQGKLTADENSNARYISVEAADDTEYEITTGIDGIARNVSIASTDYFDYPLLAWENVSNESVRFKVKWATAPSTDPNITLKVEGF